MYLLGKVDAKLPAGMAWSWCDVAWFCTTYHAAVTCEKCRRHVVGLSLAAFADPDEDPHTKLAREMGISRAQAKQLNFWVLYGTSSGRLSATQPAASNPPRRP